MRLSQWAGCLLLAGALAGCAGSSGDWEAERPDRLRLDWIATGTEALKEAERAGKPILFAQMAGPPELAWFPETAWFVYGPLQDPRVRRVLADRYVLGWYAHGNLYGHETFHPQIIVERPVVRPRRILDYALRFVFTTPSGEIRHILTEPLDTDAFLAELDRASEVLRAPAADVPRVREEFHARLAAALEPDIWHVRDGQRERSCPCVHCVAGRLAADWASTRDIGSPLIPPPDPDPFGGK